MAESSHCPSLHPHVNTRLQSTYLYREKSRQLDNFRGLSFSTISSTGANGSVIHYSPAPDGQSAVIDPNQIYLCDSGAQFTDGTTE